MSKLGPRPTALSTGVTSEALAINRRGQVLGDTGFGGSGAFLWESGRTTTLRRINAASLNDQADVVGTGGDFYHDTFHATMWRSGRTIDLGTTAGARQSGASMINNRRQVIGESGDFVNSKHGDWAHAFVWENGVMTDLGGLGGATSSANAINNRDEIAGSSTTRTGDEHAVLWTLRLSGR